MSDVLGPGPVPTEMTALDQKVGAGHQQPTSQAQHRGVIARSDDRRKRQSGPGDHALDDTELAEFADCDDCLLAAGLPAGRQYGLT